MGFGMVVEVTPWTAPPGHEVVTCWLGHWLPSGPDRHWEMYGGQASQCPMEGGMFLQQSPYSSPSLREGRERVGGRRGEALATGLLTGFEEWK